MVSSPPSDQPHVPTPRGVPQAHLETEQATQKQSHFGLRWAEATAVPGAAAPISGGKRGHPYHNDWWLEGNTLSELHGKYLV